MFKDSKIKNKTLNNYFCWTQTTKDFVFFVSFNEQQHLCILCTEEEEYYYYYYYYYYYSLSDFSSS